MGMPVRRRRQAGPPTIEARSGSTRSSLAAILSPIRSTDGTLGRVQRGIDPKQGSVLLPAGNRVVLRHREVVARCAQEVDRSMQASTVGKRRIRGRLEAQILAFAVGRVGHRPNRDGDLIGSHLLILAHFAVFRSAVVDLPLRSAKVGERVNVVRVPARFVGIRER